MTTDPEILALVPNGIENLALRCSVCLRELPSKRRSYGHCAGACHRVIVLHRRYIIGLTKCPSCLHPSTPTERAEFNLWRKSRGDRGQKGGRVKGKKYKKALDKPESLSDTPDIALCDAKHPRKAQQVVEKKGPLGASASSDLDADDGLPPATVVEPCVATPIERKG